MARTKVKVNVEIPRNRAELNEKIAELGRNERIRDKITLEMNEVIAKTKDRYAEEVKKHDDKISELQAGIAAYCEVHRDELTEGNKSKSVKLPAGMISWRISPSSVRLTKPEAIIELLKRKGLHRYIRVKEEISKDLILTEPIAVAGIKGITIISGKEELSIEPDREELERVA